MRTDYSAPLSRKLSLNLSQSEGPVSPRDPIHSSARPSNPPDSQPSFSDLGDESNWGGKNASDAISEGRIDINSDGDSTFLQQRDVSPNHNTDASGSRPMHPPSQLLLVNEPNLHHPNEPDISNTSESIFSHIQVPVDHLPPGLQNMDPKLIQWSYIDPTGKVQGQSRH